MQVVNIPIERIKPYKHNPRKIKSAIEPVAESIKEFGFKQPIVLDKNNVIIIGHVRYEAAKRLGMSEVPCVIAKNLSKQQVKALRLVDNRTREMSKWDYDKLVEELGDIGKPIDMTKFGFSFSDEINDNSTNDEVVSEYPEEENTEDNNEESSHDVSDSCKTQEKEQTYEFVCPKCGHKFNGGVYLSL